MDAVLPSLTLMHTHSLLQRHVTAGTLRYTRVFRCELHQMEILEKSKRQIWEGCCGTAMMVAEKIESQFL